MRNILIGISLALATVYFLSSTQNEGQTKELPIIQVRKLFKNELNNFVEGLNILEKETRNPTSFQKVEKLFLETRVPFKRIESLLSYLDPQLYTTSINGAPLPKVMKKVPSLMIIEPSGLQRIEELIYDENLDFKEINGQIHELIAELNSITDQTIQQNLTDPVVFEALRFGIIRINTMGITGFDSPGNPDKSLRETAISLEGIGQIMEIYFSYLPSEEKSDFNQLIQLGSTSLKKGKFEKFNRAEFHRNVADPLWRLILKVQKELLIELPHQRLDEHWSVNYSSESLFSNDFLDVDYFAEHRDETKEFQRVELGKILFFDPVLSKSQNMACATCHQPQKAFSDGLTKSISADGKISGLRNTPTILNSVFSEKFFYDFRADRLSAQMDHVIFNPDEFDSDYTQIVNNLKKSDEYLNLFQQAYGKEGITRNTVTNAVTRYVASLQSHNSLFDRYMRGEIAKIDPAIIRGYNLFSGKASCATCHFAPTFSGLVPPNFQESESEVLGIPQNNVAPYKLDEDLGRYMNRMIMEQAPFYQRSFKTGTLRNIGLTAPYMHNGVFATLEEVLDFYNEGGGVGLGMDVPHQTLPEDKLNLSKREQKDIIAFLNALTDTVGFTNPPKKLPLFELNTSWNSRKVGGNYPAK